MHLGEPMSDVQPPVWGMLQKLVPELAKWWSDRPKRRAATAAAELMFWPDGMLEELEKIAEGTATKKDVERLREKLLGSKDRVDKIIRDLVNSRAELLKCENGIAVVAQINGLTYESRISGRIHGKRNLREAILALLTKYDAASKPKMESKRTAKIVSLATEALIICNGIEAFNAAVRRLHRFVFSDRTSG
jgi:hypothetical protein